MALNPITDRDGFGFREFVAMAVVIAGAVGGVLVVARDLDRTRSERDMWRVEADGWRAIAEDDRGDVVADLIHERNEWRARADAGDGEAAEAVWRDILFTDNAVIDNIALYDLRCSQEARCSMLVSWPAYTPGSTRSRDYADLDVRLSPAPDFIP